MANRLNKSFSAKLQRSHKGGWTYVVWPSNRGKEVGKTVKVLLEERIST